MFEDTLTARVIGARVMDKATGGVPLTAGHFGPEAIPLPEAIDQVVAELRANPEVVVYYDDKLRDAVAYAWLYLADKIAGESFTPEEKRRWESELWVEDPAVLWKGWASRRRVRQMLREGNEAIGRLIVVRHQGNAAKAR